MCLLRAVYRVYTGGIVHPVKPSHQLNQSISSNFVEYHEEHILFLDMKERETRRLRGKLVTPLDVLEGTIVNLAVVIKPNLVLSSFILSVTS